MTLFTLWNLLYGGMYLLELHDSIDAWNYIMDSELHSLQHFAIVAITMLLSIAMYIDMWSPSMWAVFVEHLFFNLACIFIIYPHLTNEK